MYTRVFPRHTRLKRAPHSVHCGSVSVHLPTVPASATVSGMSRAVQRRDPCALHLSPRCASPQLLYSFARPPTHAPAAVCGPLCALRTAALSAPRARAAPAPRPAARRAPRPALRRSLSLAPGLEHAAWTAKHEHPTPTRKTDNATGTVYFIGFDFKSPRGGAAGARREH